MFRWCVYYVYETGDGREHRDWIVVPYGPIRTETDLHNITDYIEREIGNKDVTITGRDRFDD